MVHTQNKQPRRTNIRKRTGFISNNQELMGLDPEHNTCENIVRINTGVDRLLGKYNMFSKEELIDRVLRIDYGIRDVPMWEQRTESTHDAWIELTAIKDFINKLPDDYEFSTEVVIKTLKSGTLRTKNDYVVRKVIEAISAGLDKINFIEKKVRQKGGQSGKRIDSLMIAKNGQIDHLTPD